MSAVSDEITAAAAESESVPEEETPDSSGTLAEVERIDPIPSQLQLHDGPPDADGNATLGTWIVLERLKTRQFFRMLRIITRSSLPALGRLNLDPRSQTTEAFTENLIAMLVLAIPEADDETLDFLTSMVRPRDLGVTKEQSDQAWRDLRVYLQNPELDDTVNIVEAIVRREAPDLKALGKRLMAMFQLAQKTGQTKELEERQAQASSEDSQELST